MEIKHCPPTIHTSTETVERVIQTLTILIVANLEDRSHGKYKPALESNEIHDTYRTQSEPI